MLAKLMRMAPCGCRLTAQAGKDCAQKTEVKPPTRDRISQLDFMANFFLVIDSGRQVSNEED